MENLSQWLAWVGACGWSKGEHKYSSSGIRLFTPGLAGDRPRFPSGSKLHASVTEAIRATGLPISKVYCRVCGAIILVVACNEVVIPDVGATSPCQIDG